MANDRKGDHTPRNDGSYQGLIDEPFKRFKVVKKLGSGTYGKVLLADDQKTGQQVAVKTINKAAIQDEESMLRIRREIGIMSALCHPNIVKVKEVLENDENIIMVMEYASGGELYDYISERGGMPDDEARMIFRQIVSAVYYLHKHHITHRDLKLENVLLDKDHNAKIGDFGFSNYFEEDSRLLTFCGSPLYASPEIINGIPYLGPEVDCWSLGVLLYCLVYGSMPFDGNNFNRMANQIRFGIYCEPSDKPPTSASMLIRTMLEVRTDLRATVDQIANHPWLRPKGSDLKPIDQLPENLPPYRNPWEVPDQSEEIKNDKSWDTGSLTSLLPLALEPTLALLLAIRSGSCVNLSNSQHLIKRTSVTIYDCLSILIAIFV